MNTLNPKKILIRITEEQIKNGDPDFLIGILNDLERKNSEEVKLLENSVCLMFPDIRHYPLAFNMWVLGLHVKYPNFKYFLDKESLDLITIKEDSQKKCLCDDKRCAKCLSVNCVDKECPIHTKEAKKLWRENWETANNKPFPVPDNY